jgi:tRNA(Ile)-lysidine synthase
MVESFLKFVTSQGLFSHDDKILLAVSGGVDSMAMAQLFLNAGIHFSIAHVNYNLRGNHSIADRDFVKNWGESHGLQVYIKEVEPNAYDESGSIQMRAREIRYAFFEHLLNDLNYTKLATAHHLNDSIETILLNVVRGTGPQGLKGIPIKRERVIRPMMFANRVQILEYAKLYNVKWREDGSNAKIDYQRNFIRNKIAPLLKELNPSMDETFKDTLLRFEATAELVSDRKQQILNDHLKKVKNTYVLDTDWVKDDKVSLLMLSEIFSEYGLKFKTAKDLHKCILDQNSGKVFVAEDNIINIDRKKILIKKNIDLEHSRIIESDEHLVKFRQLTLDINTIENWTLSADLNIAMFDLATVKWPLTLRSWKQGDKFVPFGMKGSKLISDFLIDQKIALANKSDILVLVSGNEICWVVGYRISDKFKITKETNCVLKISVSHA